MQNYLLKQPINELPQDYKFNGIDLVKFICAYLVCIIHIAPINVEVLEKDKMGIDLSAFQFVITICCTTLLAIIIEKLMKKKSFSWLKYIFA